MRFADIENIWSVDMLVLSKADRGRVYFERTKPVVAEALTSPVERKRAVDGRRFRRDYLVEKIGAQPAVTTQNPKIKQLLADADMGLMREMLQVQLDSGSIGKNVDAKVSGLRAVIDFLLNRVDLQAAEIASLRRQRDEAGPLGGICGR